MTKQLMSGNEAVARGAWEAGVTFASAYPGTPSTEILENVATYKEINAEWAPNEKVAMEAAIGASMGGVRSMAAMKHVGLNVAADPIFTFAYMGVNGGMVFVTADDPGMHSSQNEQDNRNYAPFIKIPMLEPSDSQEAKDMFAAAFDISERFDTPVMFRMTTRVCHSKSLVELGTRREFDAIPYVKNRAKFDDVPAAAMRNRRRMPERDRKLLALSNDCEYNFAEYSGSKKIGIVASGVSYQYAREVFGDSVSYLKLGMTNPLPIDMIREFRSNVETMYVIEELDPYMENQIKAAGIDCIGKDKIPAIDELNPNIVRKALLGEERKGVQGNPNLVVPRPPALCAGCPHRGFFYELGKRKDTVMVGDIGCYALGGSEPLSAKDLANCMGSAFSVGHGLSKAFALSGQDKTVVACMGDSTFFHTGIAALEEVIYNDSHLICCILDNRITGMTGHQDNPGTGYTLKGEPATIMDIETIVRALGVESVRTVNPLHLDEMKKALDKAYNEVREGPVVLITRWPCVLKKLSTEDRREFRVTPAQCTIDQKKCIGCKKCLSTGCPALSFDKYERKAAIDPMQCVGCTVCAQVCPKQAIVKGARKA
ncbi:MAG: indolepyruvate ferredoxin oxidoreductase subunit alpha [Pyramidobacter sp.]|nr:indolepyruvate ferredoxin oxidoreductase subunit alpha [Pyramidobacter sp.]